MKAGLINSVNAIKPLVKKMVPPGIIRAGKKVVERRVQKQMVRDPKQPYEEGAFPYGINLIGPVDAATGLGQSFRLVERAVCEAGIPSRIISFAATAYHRVDTQAYREKMTDRPVYSVNLWHVSPLEFAELYARMGRQAFDRHYNIAYWLWETEDFPDEWVGYEAILDEIWTPSAFITKALKKKVHIPVFTMPYWVSAQTDPEKYNRKWFGLPENEFLYLMMYDGHSVAQRKNPDGVISAYKRAVAAASGSLTADDGRKAGLVIKAGSLTEKESRELSEKLSGCPNTHIISGSFEKTEVNSLIACADVLVSLHRAEGFGLVMAEAMLNEVPVVATDWSANTEFMDEQAACMVPCRMVRLKRDIPPYKKGSRWAQPDTGAAAQFMKQLAKDGTYRAEKRLNGLRCVREKLGRDRIVGLLQERLNCFRTD